MDYIILGVHFEMVANTPHAWVAIRSNRPGYAFSWRVYHSDLNGFPNEKDIQNVAARGDHCSEKTAKKLFPNFDKRAWEES